MPGEFSAVGPCGKDSVPLCSALFTLGRESADGWWERGQEVMHSPIFSDLIPGLLGPAEAAG